MTTDDRPARLHVEPVVVSRAARLRYILQYHRTSQLVMRLVSLGRKRWRRLVGATRWTRRAVVAPGLRDNPDLAGLLDWKLARRRERGSVVAARRVFEGHYRFLNQELTLPDPLDWRLKNHPQTPLLWRFQLHYHEFLLDLAAEAADQPAYVERAQELMLGWIAQNPFGDGAALNDAWHPYCISRRLSVWILLGDRFADLLAQETILASMAAQARFLARNLEWDVQGNHLLENLKALAIAGAFFCGSETDRWLDTASRLLQDQLDEQILSHGEHFERSPMYHALMLELVLDVRDATQTVCPELARRCDRTAGPMARFLDGLLHPDGEIPLLSDSCLGETTAPRELLRRAAEWASRRDSPTWSRLSETRIRSPGFSRIGPRECEATNEGNARAQLVGNYWTFRDRDDFVILDAGPVGPDNLPAHAHSDLLTWEASLGGKRLVVDSGVFHYQDDAMRQYCRATEAHNVLQVDDRPLCDTWSSFRMGYRGWPGPTETGQSGEFCWVRAWHNACRRSGAPRVGRFLACRPGGPWICVDGAEGTGTHRLTNWLHLHPDAKIEALDAECAYLAWQGRTVELRPLARGELSVLEGWYCPEFGVRQLHPVLRWTALCPLPTVCGWSVAWQPPLGKATLLSDGGKITVEWCEPGGRVRLCPFELR